MALGINTLGVSEYFQWLYSALGIIMTDDVRHYITVKDRARLAKLQKAKTKEEKKNRLKQKFLLLTNDEAKANKEQADNAGMHKSGVNMAEGNVNGYTIVRGLEDGCCIVQQSAKEQQEERRLSSLWKERQFNYAQQAVPTSQWHTTRRNPWC
jgi:hypothetical protein